MKYNTKKINSVFKNEYIEIQNNRVKNTYTNEEFDHIKIIENNSDTPGSVVICELNKKYFFIKSYRYGVDRECWEIPRGYKEENETFNECAIREIFEEIHVLENNIASSSLIGMVDVNSSVIASKVAIVHIRLKESFEHILQKSELISDGTWLTLKEVQVWIEKQKILDAFSLSAFMILISKENTSVS